MPGNHDIDRDVIKKSGIIQDKHEKLRTGDLENQVRRLHDDLGFRGRAYPPSPSTSNSPGRTNVFRKAWASSLG